MWVSSLENRLHATRGRVSARHGALRWLFFSCLIYHRTQASDEICQIGRLPVHAHLIRSAIGEEAVFLEALVGFACISSGPRMRLINHAPVHCDVLRMLRNMVPMWSNW